MVGIIRIIICALLISIALSLSNAHAIFMYKEHQANESAETSDLFNETIARQMFEEKKQERIRLLKQSAIIQKERDKTLTPFVGTPMPLTEVMAMNQAKEQQDIQTINEQSIKENSYSINSLLSNIALLFLLGFGIFWVIRTIRDH